MKKHNQITARALALILALACLVSLSSCFDDSVDIGNDEKTSDGIALPEELRGRAEPHYDQIAHLSNGLILELALDGEYYIVDDGRKCTSPVIVIPDTYNGLPISMIAESAFSGNEAVRSITISENVIWIDQFAFSGCTALEFNEYGNAKYLGSPNDPYAFLISSAGEDIDSVDIHESTRAIASRAFMNNMNLTEVTIPDSVVAIAKAAFDSCTSLSELDLGEGIKYIGEQAFIACTALTEIVLPASLISTDDYAFADCSSVTRLELNEGLESIGSRSFQGLAIESVVIPDSVKDFGGVFYDCRALKKIVIGDGVRVIGTSTFGFCRSLTEVEFGRSVDTVEWRAFDDCPSLEKVVLPEGLKYLDPQAFSRCDNLQYNVYKGARYLGTAENDYEYLIGFESTDMTNLELHPDMRRLMTQGLSGLANLTEISIENGKHLYVDGNCLIDRESKSLIAGLDNSVIPNDGSVTSIGDYAFYRCKEFEITNFPTKLVSIGDYAFSGCNTLFTLKFPDSLESIGFAAFDDCHGIYEIYLPDSLKSIGGDAFKSCLSLREVVIPDSVTELGEEAFRFCYNLESVTVGEGITELSGWVFQTCRRLKKVVLPSGLEVIDDRAFYGCEALSSITLPEGLLYINEKAFQRCESLTDIRLPDSLLGVGYQAFEECALTTVWIGDGLIELGEDVFGRGGSDMTLKYSGTKDMWKKIDNYNNINKSLESVTIECTDGMLTVSPNT